MRNGIKAFAWLCGVALTSPLLAAQLMVDQNGVLTGANGVIVNGVRYDVRFTDYYWAGDGDFVFTARSASDAASAALLSQVLIDGSEGRFDTNPRMVSGCEVNFWDFGDWDYCQVFTPYAISDPEDFFVVAYASVAINGPGPGGGVEHDSVWVNFDFASVVYSPITWAVWSGPPFQNPEPGTLALLGLGLAGIGLSRRRKAA